MSNLLHPDLFELIPVSGQIVAERLDDFAESHAASQGQLPDPDVSIVVRTLNEAPQLQSLLTDINAQKFSGAIELIVVDNESSDDTAEVARQHRAEVLSISPTEFTHAKSLNLGIGAASNEVVFFFSGHVNLATTQALGSAQHIQKGATGVFAWPPLTNTGATETERLMIAVFSPRIRETHQVRKAGWGALCAGNMALRRSAWQELGGFDESFQKGGEDMQLAKQILQAGGSIIYEPVLSVHHTHGLKLAKRLQRSYQTLRNIRQAQSSEQTL